MPLFKDYRWVCHMIDCFYFSHLTHDFNFVKETGESKLNVTMKICVESQRNKVKNKESRRKLSSH